MYPLAVILLTRMIRRPLREPLGAAGKVFRQMPAMEGMAHQEFGRVSAEIPAQHVDAGLDAPVRGTQMQGEDALDHQAHRQVIGHVHPVPEAFVPRVPVPPEEHAGPSGELQGQVFQVAGPAVAGQAHALEFLDHGFERIVGQGIQVVAP